MSEIEETEKLQLQFDKRGGLLPVVVQESSTGDILMLGYTNREAFDVTLASGKAAFWSTSRNKLWIKGETSGNELHIVEILTDCDQDALVYKVTMAGNDDGACHTKGRSGKFRKTCFYRNYDVKTGVLKNTIP